MDFFCDYNYLENNSINIKYLVNRVNLYIHKLTVAWLKYLLEICNDLKFFIIIVMEMSAWLICISWLSPLAWHSLGDTFLYTPVLRHVAIKRTHQPLIASIMP